jgi:putative phosphoribosyl transferase
MTALAMQPTATTGSVAVRIPVGSVILAGRLAVPEAARGLVIVANGDGDHIYDRGNDHLASYLTEAGFATLLVDLLTPLERVEDAETSELRFNEILLASRLVRLTIWARSQAPLRDLTIGFLTGGPCAGAALAAARVSGIPRAVVCRGGQIDPASTPLHVNADVLLLVGERDAAHLKASRELLRRLPASARLYTVPDASHALEELHVRPRVSHLAEDWFAWSLDPQLCGATYTE